MIETLFLTASPLENQGLRPTSAEPKSQGSQRYWQYGRDVWACCGIGPAAAALFTQIHLQRFKPKRVVLAGIAGAYNTSGFAIGAVVQAESDVFADLGYRDERGFHNLDKMGLAHWSADVSEPGLSCSFPLGLLVPHDPYGRFTTVSLVTNDHETGSQLATQYGAVAENMEGAAVAMACSLCEVPCYQVRSISNLVGPRNPAEWRIREALANLKAWLDSRVCGSV